MRRLFLAAAVLWAFSTSARAAAQGPVGSPRRPPSFTFSVQDVVLLPGDYEVSVADASLQAGLGAGLELSAEVVALSSIDLGAQLLVMRRDSDDARLDTSTLSHLGVHVGPVLVRSPDLLLSAVALLGYHIVSFADAEELTTGLGLGALACLWLRVAHWVWFRAQLGLLAQPLGGHDASDVTLPPTGLFGLGFALSAPASSG